MNARTVLLIHTSLFFSFAAVSLASPFLLHSFPELLTGKYVAAGAVMLTLAVVGSWPLFGGCPLTILENRARARARAPQYSGPCIDHYVLQWLGIRLPARLSTGILVGLLLLPIVAGSVNW